MPFFFIMSSIFTRYRYTLPKCKLLFIKDFPKVSAIFCRYSTMFRFSTSLTMLPLQLTRIFDYQQPATDMYRSDSSRVNAADGSSQTGAATEIIEERRQQTDRRALERREKQQATFLNTRKMQGRRRSAGRRANDAQNTYRPISLKG